MRKYIIGKLFKKLGYDIRRIKSAKNKDLELYQIYPKIILKEKQFYNIGAGKFKHPYWTTIDYISTYYKDNPVPDININLLSCSELPIKDNSAWIVYTSHVLEHLTNKAVQNILNESYRILDFSGILRIVVPDADLSFNALINNDRHFFHWETSKNERRCLNTSFTEASIIQLFIYDIASNVSIIHGDGAKERITDEVFMNLFYQYGSEWLFDYCSKSCDLKKQRKYPGNHINWFNENKLRKMLTKAGFKNIYRSGFQQSREPVLRNTYYFDTAHHKSSLYMEAVK